MVLKKDLEKRVEKKRAELDLVKGELIELSARATAIEAVINELLSIIKALPKDDSENAETPDRELRHGSDVYNAREALRKAKKPLYIDRILESMGKEATPEAR